MAVVDFSALSAYVDQVSGKMIKKALLTDRTLQTGVNIQTGIKSAEAINILTGSLIGQSTACGMSPTGSVALTQRNIVVCPITVYEDICAAQFDAYWTQIMNPAGSYYDKNPIEQVYVDQKTNALAKLVGEILWRGDTAGYPYTGTTSSAVTGNITLCNGILHDLEFVAGSASVIVSTFSGTAMTVANSVDIINDMIANVLASAPDMLTEMNKTIYVSYSYLNMIRQRLFALNLYHYTGDANQGGEWMLKNFTGTGFDILATEGLNTAARAVLTYGLNITYGCDLENDQDKFEVFYDQRLDTVYFRAKWKQGVKIAFPGQVVLYKGGTY